MKFGLMMECDYREGRTQEDAFDEAFETAVNAEAWGFDGVWLAERHFAPPGSGRAIPSVVASPLIFATAIAAKTSHIRVGTAVLVLPLGHPVRMAEEAVNAEAWGFDGVWLAERHFAPPGSGRAIPSVVASPLIFATAIAAKTSHIRVGTAVLVLPLGHPVRMAEEVATLDNISRGRLDLGIGRSGFPWAYDGYDIPYSESRARFREYYNFRDVCLIPKPYQKPHPPLRYAASTRETFAAMGEFGLPIFAGLGGAGISDLSEAILEYRAAWKEAGHPGEGDVILRVGVYVAEDMGQALSEPRKAP